MGQIETHLLGLSEAGAQQRQEDSGDGYVVSWLSEARVLSTGEHRHAPGDVSDGHLVTLRDDAGNKKIRKTSVHSNVCVRFLSDVSSYVFLNTQLLELDKLGASGLQVESPSGLVGDALLAGTHDEGHEGGGLDLWDEMTHDELLIRVRIKHIHPLIKK